MTCKRAFVFVAVLLPSSPALASDGFLWGVHGGGQPGGTIYHFDNGNARRPVSFTFGQVTMSALVDLEAGYSFSADLALSLFLRAQIGIPLLGNNPPYKTMAGRYGAGTGIRLFWDQEAGESLFTDLGVATGSFGYTAMTIYAPDNVDLHAVYGPSIGAGLGWPMGDGFELRMRLGVDAMFNDDARVVLVGFEVQIGHTRLPSA